MPYKDPLKARACWHRREQKPERIRYRKTWRAGVGISASRRYAWKTVYGITPDEYFQMLSAQGGGCAICGRAPQPGKVLCVDHNHQTNKVRGLLCHGCNHALGCFGDTVEGLRKAIQYLDAHDVIQ